MLKPVMLAAMVIALPAVAADRDQSAGSPARDCRQFGAQTITVRPGDDLQRVIDRAPVCAIISFSPGTYRLDAALHLKSGVALVGQPGARLRPAGRNNDLTGTGVHDVLIAGLDFDGGPAGGGGIYTGAIFIADHSDGVVIRDNSFHDNWNQNDVFVYNSSHIYVQHNRSGPDEYQPISMHNTVPGETYRAVEITDNRLFGFRRMGIETFVNAEGLHIDRNEIGPFGGGRDTFAISVVGSDHHHPKMAASGTIWGNVVHGTPGAGQWGIELGQTRMTVAANRIDGTDVGICPSAAPGSIIEDNIIADSKKPFMRDGDYDGSEWIGFNMVDGRRQFGWANHANGPRPALQQPAAAPTPVAELLRHD